MKINSSHGGKISKIESIIIIPCYNEEKRLPVEEFTSFVEKNPEIRFMLIDDGSRDGTLRLLRRLETEKPGNFKVIPLELNRGKAEAVRKGMLAAFDEPVLYIGYWDADLSTPLLEIPRFIEIIKKKEALIVFGARVKLMGREVERRPIRHYAGRVFATLASITLHLPIYDTQCGAKLFRNLPEMRALFERPFVTSWIFDVEILARLLRLARKQSEFTPERVLVEVPLMQWVDVPGSKVRAGDFFNAIIELIKVHRRYLSDDSSPKREIRRA